jgi:hypothetical protein
MNYMVVIHQRQYTVEIKLVSIYNILKLSNPRYVYSVYVHTGL